MHVTRGVSPFKKLVKESNSRIRALERQVESVLDTNRLLNIKINGLLDAHNRELINERRGRAQLEEQLKTFRALLAVHVEELRIKPRKKRARRKK